MNLLSGPPLPLDDGCGSWSDRGYRPLDVIITRRGYTIITRRGHQLHAALRWIDSAPQDDLSEEDCDALATARMLIEGVLAS